MSAGAAQIGGTVPAVPGRPRTPYALLDPGGVSTLLILVGVFLAPSLAWVVWGAPLGAGTAPRVAPHMLLWSTLLCLVLPMLEINLAIRRHGGSAIRGNRDAYPRATGILGRLSRAHANAIESLAPFAAAVLAAHSLGVANRWTVGASVLYLAARVTHSISYMLGVTILRSSAFYAGWFATLAMAAIALI